MENKDSIRKLIHLSQDNETNERKKEKNQTSAILDAMTSQIGSPSHNNGSTTVNQQQCPPTLQSSHTPQPTLKQSPLLPREPVPTQQPQSINAQQQQQNSINSQPQHQHQEQHQQWLPQGPGLHSLIAPFRNEPNIPRLCYEGGFQPHSMGFFPGTWDPSSWWAQMQQSPQLPFPFPGAYSCIPLPSPPVPENSVVVPFGGHTQRGVILSKAKLSQKHQQMWDAQSLENIQLRASINQLQSEMSSYRSQLMKLESEISSLKLKLEPSSAGTVSVSTKKALKRGRPKKVVSADMFTSLGQPQSNPHGRKITRGKNQSKTMGLQTEKESSNTGEEKPCEPELPGKATTHQANEGKMSNILTNNSDLKMPMDAQVATNFNSLNPTMEIKQNCKKPNNQNGLSNSYKHVMETNEEVVSAAKMRTMNNESHDWAANASSSEGTINLLDVRTRSFYNNVNDITQGKKVVLGWSSVNEDALQEHEDGMVRSGKDNDKDTSRGADAMDQSKA